MAYDQMNVRQVIERSLELEAIVGASPEYRKIRSEEGLNGALKWNAARFEDEDAWFKQSKDRT